MIMINDLLKDWESRWKYVDDTTLSETVIVNDQSVLQCTLDGINLWCEENDMVLNTRKCKEILICFWKKKPNFQQLTVNNYPVEHVNSEKLLGVMLSSDLKWNEHVACIVKKSSRRLYILRLLKRANADTKTLITVYRTCIRPILEYCNQIWHFNIPEYLSNDIERIQRRALKPLSDLGEIAVDPGYDLRAGRKFEPIKCMTNRFKNSFIPSSVEQFLNVCRA